MKSFISKLKRLIRLFIPSKRRLAMRVLYAESLGWSFLPKKPKPIIGKIFDQDSISLPWFSYPAIAQLLRFDLNGEYVLEYGGGSSTSFFLEQGAQVLTIEDSPLWAEYLRNKTKSNPKSQIICCNKNNGYVKTPSELSQLIPPPSIILIDAKKRLECSLSVAEYINIFSQSKNLWLVILDNSDWHGASYSALAKSNGFIGFDYYGKGPFNAYSWCTTLFVRINSDKLCNHFKHAGPAQPMNDGLQENYDPTI